jgi:hypothetical protein
MVLERTSWRPAPVYHHRRLLSVLRPLRSQRDERPEEQIVFVVGHGHDRRDGRCDVNASRA